ncbi:ketohexokinase [Drosophila serrata]|uniref:ketohexokinase n=1 Tax=Drosophila serrata TaxID=7274 RepID=UPI000A1D0BC9|nr:ketohexokinase [Drosophila serrata]
MSKWSAVSVLKSILCVGCTEVDYVTTVEKVDFQRDRSRTQDGYMVRGGRSSNVSTVLRLLGARAELFGVLSSNPMYSIILDDLEKRGIDISHCTFTDESPPFSIIVQERFTRRCTTVYCDKPFPYVTAEDFKKLDLNQYGWVHFEGRSPVETCDMIRLVLDHNNELDETDRIVVSLQIYNAFDTIVDLIGMPDYVILTKYVAELKGWTSPRESCDGLNSILRMPRSINIRRPCFIVPWSSLGAGCMTRDGNYFELPAHKPKKIVDRVGDSDCFTAGFIYANFVRGRQLAHAVDFANAVASYKLAHVGYDCLGSMKVDAVKLNVHMEPDQGPGSSDSENENESDRICRKYLHRPFQLMEADEASIVTDDDHLPS